MKSIASHALAAIAIATIALACACKTPKILLVDPPGKCGQWPVQCAISMGGGCCWEGWACFGQEDCEYMGTDTGGIGASKEKPKRARTH